MNRSHVAIAFSSLYLLVYSVLINTGFDRWLWLLFCFWPIVLIATVYTVIRYGKYTDRELMEGEEWGYEDWDK